VPALPARDAGPGEAETQHPDVRVLFVNQGEGAETARRFLETEGLVLEHVLFD